MSEGHEASPYTGAYPSAGPPDPISSAPADPFGPDVEQTGDFDPFAPRSVTTAIPAVPEQAQVTIDPSLEAGADIAETTKAGATEYGASGAGRPQGIPRVDRSQVRDERLAASLFSRGGADHIERGRGQDRTPSPPFGPDPGENPGFSSGSEGPISAARTAPQELFNNSRDLNPATGVWTDAAGVSASAARPSQPAEAPAGAAVYPSAEALPVKSPQRALGRGLKRMIRSENLPTAPMRVVDRLVNTPFANPRRNKGHSEARRTLNFALQLAETMFHYGADAMDVESAIVAVCATYGVENVDVDITNQSVTINYVSGIGLYEDREQAEQRSSEEIFSHTVVRVVRSWSDNYAGLTHVHRLVKEITDGELPRPQAQRKLDRIMSQPKPYPRWAINLATVGAVMALSLALGSEWLGAVVAGLGLFLNLFVSAKLGTWRIPEFFQMAVAGIIVTMTAMVPYGLGVDVSPPLIVASGLIMLLPTLRLVSTMQDAINGFPVTAAGRMISTGLTFLGLVVGLAIAIAVSTSFLGFETIDVSEVAYGLAPPPQHITFMLLATTLIAVSVQVRPRHIVPGLVSSAIGLVVYYAVIPTGLGPRMLAGMAAIAIGCASAWLANRHTIPQAVIAVPGVTFLLPGLSIFRGMYLFTVDIDPIQGLVPMINASAIIMSLAAAVVLGNYLMRPFMRTRDARKAAWKLRFARHR